MSLIAWYRPHISDNTLIDYGKDADQSNLIEKKTSNNHVYYTLQKDFDEAFKTIGEFTVSAWVTIDDTIPAKSFGQPGFKGLISMASGRSVGFRETNAKFCLAYYDDLNVLRYLSSPNGLNDDEYHWVAVTQDTEKVTLYIDGEKVASALTHINGGVASGSVVGNFIADLEEGAFSSLSDSSWGDLRIYDKALSENSLKAIYEANSYQSTNATSKFKALTRSSDGKALVLNNHFIMQNHEGLYRTVEASSSLEYSTTSPIYFYRGPDYPDCILDGYLISSGPVDARKAFFGSYSTDFEFIGPIYLNATSTVNLHIQFESPLGLYSPTETSILVGDVLNREDLVFVNLKIGENEVNDRVAYNEFFKGVVSGASNFPKEPWKAGDYIVVSDSFTYVGTSFVKGNAYVFDGTEWSIIEVDGTNSARLQELLGLLIEAGIDLEDINNANTTSWFNRIVANAIEVGQLALVKYKYGFSNSNTVEPTVWSDVIDTSHDGEWHEATWGNSYIAWEDGVVRFVVSKGAFLWIKTSSDNGKTWSIHCATGDEGASPESITPVHYYTSSSTVPSRPTSPVISTSKSTDVWTREIPDYIPDTSSATYKYYTCQEIEYDTTTAGTNGFAWTEVVEDTVAAKAGYSYFNFIAQNGLFQSIQGEVGKSVSTFTQTSGDISLQIASGSGSKVSVGGIYIKMVNGQPVIDIKGALQAESAFIQGLLTVTDVIAETVKDYAGDHSVPVSSLMGAKFLPSDLSSGYAFSDSAGTLQANNAYIRDTHFEKIHAEGFETGDQGAFSWNTGAHTNWNGPNSFDMLVLMFNAIINMGMLPSDTRYGVPFVYRGRVKVGPYDFTTAKGEYDTSPIGANEGYLVLCVKDYYPKATMAQSLTYYYGGHSLAIMYANVGSSLNLISYDGAPWEEYVPTSADYSYVTVGWAYSQPAIKGLTAWKGKYPSDTTPTTIGDEDAPFDHIFGDRVHCKQLQASAVYGTKVYGAVFNP